MRNEALCSACEVWVRAALELLSAGPVPTMEDIEVTLTPNGGFNTQWEITRPDYARAVFETLSAVSALSEFDALLDLVIATSELSSALLVDAAGQAVSPSGQKWWLSSRMAYRFLADYAKDVRGFDFVPEVFEKVYSTLERFVYDVQIDARWLIDLRNLTLEFEQIDLEAGVRLRRASAEERTKIIRDNHWFGAPIFLDIPDTFVEIDQALGRIDQPDQLGAETIARQVMLALRLLKPSPVGFVTLRWSVLDQPFRLAGAITSSPDVTYSAFRGQPYMLDSGDAATLAALWPKVKHAVANEELSIPLTRLDDSYVRTKDEDKLIDYWTALEALFLPRGANISQQGKMVAAIVAHYIGSTASVRKQISSALEESHDLRNKLIHADQIKRKEKIAEMVDKTGEYLRLAMRRRIEE